jgi:hypothetical protein
MRDIVRERLMTDDDAQDPDEMRFMPDMGGMSSSPPGTTTPGKADGISLCSTLGRFTSPIQSRSCGISFGLCQGTQVKGDLSDDR